MKILKIELQNINSLKSNTPIVIDFENEVFKDVGLFAITGSTGAGKTTILDAITIALYHRVPRFNNNKGALIDVVSFGANGAFSRVTFFNNGKKYEAFWGTRLKNKSGAKLKNPIEEVSLKNLTDNIILASKKRDLIVAIEQVTQLNYNQFLRSVMLAQGEFASFLSAKGAEKGKLLEQITGEEIYKKIGEQILLRKSAEEKILAELNAKINDEDILSTEEKIKLKEEEKTLNEDIKTLEQEHKTILQIVNWYTDFQKIISNQEQLALNAKEVAAFEQKHQENILKLKKHNLAEPFKDSIASINRTKKMQVDNALNIADFTKNLKELEPKIETATAETTKLEQRVKEAENIFNQWLPVFDKISALDTKIANEEKELNQKNNDLALQREAKIQLDATLKKLENEKENYNKQLTETAAFIEENHFLTAVNTKISQWNSSLTTLKNNKTQSNAYLTKITSKKEGIDRLTADYQLAKNKNETASKTLEKLKLQLQEVNQQLSALDIAVLSAKEKALIEEQNALKELKSLAIQFSKAHTNIDRITIEQKYFDQQIATFKKQNENLAKQLEKQNQLVATATENIALKRSIKNYEEDRKRLKEGESCPLCGSKEHPFAMHNEVLNISESEQKLSVLKDELKNIEANVIKNEHEIAVLRTKKEANVTKLQELEHELKEIEQKQKALNIVFDLANVQKIDMQFNLLENQLKTISKQLEEAQKLSKAKETLNADINSQIEEVNALKINLAKQKEKLKSLNEEIVSKQVAKEKLDKSCADTEKILAKELGDYNYQLPTAENTEQFIASITQHIAHYQTQTKTLDDLKNALSQVQINTRNSKKQLEEKEALINTAEKYLLQLNTSIKTLKEQRTKLLPATITVQQKRAELQEYKRTLNNKFQALTNKLQQLKEEKSKNQTLLKNHQIALEKLKLALDKLNIELDEGLKNSSFNTKQEIENALLSQELKQEYTQIEQKINTQRVKIETLKKQLDQQKETLLKQKDFELSHEASQIKFEEIQNRNTVLHQMKGAIKEKFDKDEIIKNRNQAFFDQIAVQEKTCMIWRDLFRVIGNSKDAFNTYVQRLTLKQLLDLANVHLYQLNKRYSLKMEDSYKPKEELNFMLIDHYQTDQERLVDTSSGGEKFIISLALALGLSDLASKNVRIDSLFIDEGFGTLDNNTLETVISTLETLQSQGKIIGIISHVENLKERIPKQIQISKKSNGISVVNIL